MPTSDQHQQAKVASRRKYLVRRLATCLAIAFVAVTVAMFARFALDGNARIAFTVSFVLLTVLAASTFLAAILARDLSIALASGFGLALVALYWLIMITHGVTEFLGSSYHSGPAVMTRRILKTPNQAMQLTASKPAFYAGGVCHRERMLRGMHRGLAAADLVSR